MPHRDACLATVTPLMLTTERHADSHTITLIRWLPLLSHYLPRPPAPRHYFREPHAIRYVEAITTLPPLLHIGFGYVTCRIMHYATMMIWRHCWRHSASAADYHMPFSCYYAMLMLDATLRYHYDAAIGFIDDMPALYAIITILHIVTRR